MSLYEYLTMQDLINIRDYCGNYGFQDNDAEYDLRPVPTEEFLKEWSEQKEHIFHLFGDKFILKKSISVDPTIDLFYEVYDDCMAKQNKGYELSFVTEYKNQIANHFQTPDYWGLSPIGRKLMSLVDLDKLYTNTVNEEIRFELDGKKVVIHKGEKIMRALRKVSTLLEIPFNLFEEFRIFFSQVTQYSSCQQNNTLCLSIHPLDFMTMSDNDHGWTSCMSWQEPGTYRGGTLEMMNSPHVIVAYITDGKNMELPDDGAEWPSKRWRELYYFDDNLITGIKGYPYTDDKVDQIVRDWLKELTNFDGDELILNRIGKAQMDEPENEKFYEKYNYETGPVVVRSHANYMYNDFDNNPTYPVVGALTERKSIFREWRSYNYSGEAECMCCGKIVDFDDSNIGSRADSLVCVDIVDCVYCGRSVERSEAIEHNGEYYCSDCYDENFTYCEKCGQLVPNDEIRTVVLERPQLDLYMQASICTECFEKFKHMLQYREIHEDYTIIPSELTNINDIFDLFDAHYTKMAYYRDTVTQAKWDKIFEQLKAEGEEENEE